MKNQTDYASHHYDDSFVNLFGNKYTILNTFVIKLFVFSENFREGETGDTRIKLSTDGLY